MKLVHKIVGMPRFLDPERHMELIDDFVARERDERIYDTFRRDVIKAKFGYSRDTIDKCRTEWPTTTMKYLQYRTIAEFLRIADEAHSNWLRRSWFCLAAKYEIGEESVRKAYKYYRENYREEISTPTSRPRLGPHERLRFVLEEECPGNHKDPRPQPREVITRNTLARKLPFI